MTARTIRYEYGTEWEPWWSGGFVAREECRIENDERFDLVWDTMWYYGLALAGEHTISAEAVISRMNIMQVAPHLYWPSVRVVTAIMEGRSTNIYLDHIIRNTFFGIDILEDMKRQDWNSVAICAAVCLRYYLSRNQGNKLLVSGAKRFINGGFDMLTEWGVLDE